MPASRPSRAALVLLIGYAVGLGLLFLLPFGWVPTRGSSWLSGHAARLGAPEWFVVRSHFEAGCNILVLMPLSALGSLAWPRTTWRDWTAYAFVVAAAVELLQWWLLPERQPSFVDIVANTLGGLGGAVVVAVWRRLFGSGRSAA
jgi:hypothetical protein